MTTARKPFRRGSTVTLLRTYAAVCGDPDSGVIKHGTRVQVVEVIKAPHAGRLITITDGTTTIANLPPHVLRADPVNA